MPQSDGDIARRFEQAASKNKARHNTASSPRKVKAQTVILRSRLFIARAPFEARGFSFFKNKNRRSERWTKVSAAEDGIGIPGKARHGRPVFPAVCCIVREQTSPLLAAPRAQSFVYPLGGRRILPHPLLAGIPESLAVYRKFKAARRKSRIVKRAPHLRNCVFAVFSRAA